MASYIALIRKDPDSDFSVDFSDFPGCVTAGGTLDEARALATEALAFHVRGMLEDGDAIPAPSALEDVMADPHNRDSVAFLVDLRESPARSVRINITLPEPELSRIDEHAARQGLSRSGFLLEAAKRAMKAA